MYLPFIIALLSANSCCTEEAHKDYNQYEFHDRVTMEIKDSAMR